MAMQSEGSDCRSCESDAGCASAPNRREFLHVAGCVGLTIAAFGISSTAADGLPVLLIEGVPAGSEMRYPIPVTDSVNVDRTAQLIVARSQGHVYVFALSCPHQNNVVKW